MASETIVLTNASVVLDDSTGTPQDISNQVSAVNITLGYNTETTGCMGTSSEISTTTLKTASFSFDVFAEFGADKISNILNGLYDVGNITTLVVKPENVAVSATNPSYTAEVALTSFPALSGSHGDVLKGSAEFALASGDVAISIV